MGNDFEITAVQQGESALIRITGTIGWATNAEDFRTQVDAIIKEGVSNAHIYINSPGGSCFDAAEIVNIIGSFKGSVTGEGGAIVASAATYIALACRTFEMPENGMFMIHKPSGGAYGTADELRNYLKALQDIEAMYYSDYKALAKSAEVFDAKWKSGDWWMTAKEAKENGFITEVREKTKINRAAAASIKACGCPFEIIINDNNLKKETEMDVKTTAIALGLPETASEAEVRAKLEENRTAASELAALRATQAQKEKAEREAKIKAALDKATADKRITADCRAEWEKMLNDNYDAASKVLAGIAAVEKLSSQIITSKEGVKTYKGKTFAQLQDENPELLAELDRENPEAFAELFNETFKTK